MAKKGVEVDLVIVSAFRHNGRTRFRVKSSNGELVRDTIGSAMLEAKAIAEFAVPTPSEWESREKRGG